MTQAAGAGAGTGKSAGLGRRVSSNFVWSLMSVAVGKGAFVFANIYLARSLGVSGFGMFMLAQTVALYFWLAVDLGTNMYGIREIAKNKDDAEGLINTLMGLRITAGVLMFALYSLGLVILGYPHDQTLAFAGCGLYLITYSLYSDWVFKGLERFKFIAYGSLVSSVVFLAGVLAVVKSGEDVALAAFLWSGSFFLASVSLLRVLTRRLGIRFRPAFNPGQWLPHLKESIYFTVSGGLMTVYNYLPLFLLKYYYTDFEVGLFSAPFRVVLAVGGAGFLIPSSFYPVLAELYHRDIAAFRKMRQKLQLIMLALGAPVAVVAFVFAEEGVRLIWGPEYMGSVPVVRVTCWLVPLYFIRYSYGSVLFATGFQKWQNLGGLAGAAGILVSSFILVPVTGVLGASDSLVFSEALIVLTMMAVSNRVLGEKRLMEKAAGGAA
ncbi:MAG: flippase [Nitrospirae bacterium]|nr:flippase [Nitrospirota bacterium]MBI5696178.1 flippase [Nitrospirota bacterium]